MHTILSNLHLRGREILSSYASFTLEAELSADVVRGDQRWRIRERNGIPKGTSDGANEAVYLPAREALASLTQNLAPLLPARIEIREPRDILEVVHRFDLAVVRGAGVNKRDWGGNACLAASTVLFQTLLRASGYEPWELLGTPTSFTFPNLAFIMVCGGEHVPGTKQDIQEMFLFVMRAGSLYALFALATRYFRQFEQNLVRDGLPTGTAKERGFVFPVADNLDGLRRIHECAAQLGLSQADYAVGTDNAFSELQHGLVRRDEYELRFSGGGTLTRAQLVELDHVLIHSAPNFISMEDPASEHDLEAHRMVNARDGGRVQLVLDDLVVTQLRFLIPCLCATDPALRAGNSVLIKMNQAGTFTEARLAIEVVLGLADVEPVEAYLAARGELASTLAACADVGVGSLREALANIAAGGFSAFLSHRSTEGSSELLPMLALLYGGHSERLWLKAGAPNGERNLQHYNPLLRAEEALRERGIPSAIAGARGLPLGVEVPAFSGRSE